MLTLSDVVLTLGTAGNERVLLRGADLSVAGGDTVLLTGLDAPARRAMADLLAGRIRPAYGSVTLERGDAGRTVLDAGDEPSDGIWQDLGGASPPRAVVVLAGRRPAGWPDRYRCLELRGGRFVPGRAGATVRVPLALLEQRIRQALTEAGAPPAASASVARVLVDAECRGHRSHGVALLPTYLRRISAGGIVAGARPALTEVTGSLAVVDAGGGFGQPAMDVAAEWCAAAAAATGVAAVAVHNNNHVGMLAAYRWPFQRDDVVGLLMNTSGPSVSAPGAAYPTLGSNALCLVTPGAAGEPFCIDLATGVVAAGKIRDAANLGVPVPEAWLRDAAGRPTTDPDELDRGGSIPLFGGYKGLCVTLIVEILAGALAGGRVSPDVAKQRKLPDTVMGCGQLLIGVSAAHVSGREPPHAFLGTLREAVRAGYDEPPPRPWFPDQVEEDTAADVRRHGAPVPVTVLRELGWPAGD
ncbi:Ldh family oxidoreductase [Nonomuraea sp. NPDC049504]|uniref:Ldh family oxidoreductase n=1 Tax=Nonomuraea sp. NPDC049504 TaxID=3154729 RepID=UPI0034467BCD